MLERKQESGGEKKEKCNSERCEAREREEGDEE